MKVPPVEDESVMTTLVAFTCRASAAEPVAIVSVVAGDVIEIDSDVVKLRGAAWTEWVTRIAPMMPRRGDIPIGALYWRSATRIGFREFRRPPAGPTCCGI